MKKKKQKQNPEWLARAKRHQRGPYVPPPDHRWRDWGRSLLILLLGLLLPFLWFVAEEIWRHDQAKVAAVNASIVMTTPDTTQGSQSMPARIADNRPAPSKDEATQAARTLGFLHTVGAPAFFGLCVLIFCGISFFLFEEPATTGPSVVRVMGSLLISTVISALLWRYGYVPLVDLIWEACGGRIEPYKLHDYSKSRHHRISDHEWGENAALLFWLAVGLIAGAVGKLKAAVAEDHRSR